MSDEAEDETVRRWKREYLCDERVRETGPMTITDRLTDEDLRPRVGAVRVARSGRDVVLEIWAAYYFGDFQRGR